MRKIYVVFVSLTLMLVGVCASAQTTGYTRLQNVTTGHVANLSGGTHFAPDVTLEEAYALPSTVAYADFDEKKVTQLHAQGVDVVNTMVPLMKEMVLQIVTEEKFFALKDSAIYIVNQVLSGAMGTMMVGFINNYTYAQFQEYVSNLDTNLYYVATDGGYILYFNSPSFPFNAGDFTQYFTNKANSFITLYRGTFQEYALPYLEGREHLIPVVNSMISHLKFGDYFYLCEKEDPDYGPYLGFANSDDLADSENTVWDFIPVDETNYLGVEGKCKDGDGKWWTALSVGFPFRLAQGMKAYYVDGEIDYTKSLIHRVEVTDDVIPALTPVILLLNGENAESNKLELVEDSSSESYPDNQLRLPTDSRGFMLGFTLDESDPHYYLLGITDGKVALKVTDQTVFSPNEAYYFLPDYLVSLLSSGSLTLADEVSGIEEQLAATHACGKYYDLQGRPVEKPTKGVYIVNGKKVMVK